MKTILDKLILLNNTIKDFNGQVLLLEANLLRLRRVLELMQEDQNEEDKNA